MASPDPEPSEPVVPEPIVPLPIHRAYDASTRSQRVQALENQIRALEQERWTAELHLVAVASQRKIMAEGLDEEGHKLEVEQAWTAAIDSDYRATKYKIASIDEALTKLRQTTVS
jgi:hypothetical protein